MKRITAILILLSCIAFKAAAQDYVAPAVNISTEKVSRDGKLYYSHIVTARQTVYSICKAYNVKEQDLYDANSGLKEKGLKMDSIILIPATLSETPKAEIVIEKAVEAVVEEKTAETAPVQETASAVATSGSGKTTVHKVKWYEDLDAIAERYGVSAEAIMKANNLTSTAISARQRLIIPSSEEAAALDNEKLFKGRPKDNNIQENDEALADDTEKETMTPEEVFQGKDNVSMTIILPLKAQAGGSEGNMDFYSGLLLAASDKADEGILSDIRVYDMSAGMPSASALRTKADFILGPVSPTDIKNILDAGNPDNVVVSPLDPRAESLTKDYTNLIQAPTPSVDQYKDIVNWIKEDNAETDRTVVIYEKYSKEVADSSTINLILRSSGLSYSTFSYSILEGRNILGSLTNLLSTESTTRFIIASEKEAFVNDVIRNICLLVHSGNEVALYAPAKVRNFETIDVENLHNANLHMSLTYDIDYDDAKVKAFLMKYRALYNTEPNAYAFQGYDLGHYLITMVAKYGDRWMEMVTEEKVSELQASFRMEAEEDGGKVNRALRRVIYGPDYSIKVVEK